MRIFSYFAGLGVLFVAFSSHGQASTPDSDGCILNYKKEKAASACVDITETRKGTKYEIILTNICPFRISTTSCLERVDLKPSCESGSLEPSEKRKHYTHKGTGKFTHNAVGSLGPNDYKCKKKIPDWKSTPW